VITPPIIGVAIRFITSAPAWVAGDHMMGSRPKRIALTVMIFGPDSLHGSLLDGFV
jgi:hypothetical protein